jgi:hypothetical protein
MNSGTLIWCTAVYNLKNEQTLTYSHQYMTIVGHLYFVQASIHDHS